MNKKDKIKIIIVDDHMIFRKGLRLMIEDFNFVDIIGEAESGQEFLTMLNKLTPDVVLMDIKMPGMSGIETTQLAVEQYPDLTIIALTMHEEEEYVKSMFDAGSKGYILKNVSKEELKKALRTIADGKSYYYSANLSSLIINHFLDTEKNSQSKALRESKLSKKINLSPRCSEILKYLCEGMTNEDIAKKLNLSERTIQGHRGRILKKVGVKNTPALIRFAILNNMVKI